MNDTRQNALCRLPFGRNEGQVTPSREAVFPVIQIDNVDDAAMFDCKSGIEKVCDNFQFFR